jgi:hypothetical protein
MSKKRKAGLVATFVLGAGLMTSAIQDVKTKINKTVAELTKVEIVIKEEKTKAKINHYTWKEVRRRIAMDVKLKKQLELQKVKLIRDEAYFEAKRKEFEKLAGEEAVHFNVDSEHLVEGIRREIPKILSLAKLLTNKTKLTFTENLSKLEAIFRLNPRQLELFSKFNQYHDQLSEEELDELYTIPGKVQDLLKYGNKQKYFLGHWDKNSNYKEYLRNRQLADLERQKRHYYDLIVKAEKAKKVVSKLLGFIEHEELQDLLGDELNALLDLENALDEEIRLYENLITYFEDTLNNISALSASS